MIYYGCPNCQTPMASPDSLAGQADKCPACGNMARVPTVAASAPAPAPPPPPALASRVSAPPALPPQAPAAPVPGTTYNPKHAGQVVTTEKTSKQLKAHGCLSTLMVIAGVVLTMVGVLPVGIPLLAFGLVWFLVTRISIWWKHG